MLDYKKLAELRKAHGITQDHAAAIAGVSIRTYQRYEKGQTEPTDSTLADLARMLDVSIEELKSYSTSVEEDIQNLVNEILTQFGPQHQAIILIEEMSELTKVLCKIQRGKFNRGKLNEEFTHVQVSCEVIRKLMDIKNRDVREQVRAKLQEYASMT